MKNLIIIVIIFLSFSHANSQFAVSYKAGQTDSKGNFIGGTEMRLLCQHKGMLFGGIETWMDSVTKDNKDPDIGAQILRLDSPEGQWQLDYHFDTKRNNPLPGQRTLFRNEGVTALESVIFENDSNGIALPKPDTILIATCRDFNGIASIYTRNDLTGEWTETVIAQKMSEKATIRSLILYRDKVTKADLVFAGCLPQGLIGGVYDASLPGKIRWLKSEITADTSNIGKAGSGSWQGRPMAFTECNGELYCAAAPIILKRKDGNKGTWTEVVRYPMTVTPGGSSGLRGLTAIPNPTGIGQSLLAAMEGNSGLMARATPSSNLPYSYSSELNIMTSLTTAWESIPPSIKASYVVVANSDMTWVKDPINGDSCLIITIQHHPAKSRDDAFYYIRRQKGTNISYQLMRIDNSLINPSIVLNSTRACQLSPFKSDSNKYLYFGGYDADDNPTHNTAYVLRVPLMTAFGYTTTTGYQKFSNIKYCSVSGVDDNLLSLDIYKPNNNLSKLPVMIYIHGGYWNAGDKIAVGSKAKLFTDSGYVFVSINYRLSPNPEDTASSNAVRFPVHPQDCAKAIKWVYDSIANYNGDNEKISLIGHSAGAHLVLLLSTNETFLNNEGLTLKKIKCTCSLDAGVFDVAEELKQAGSSMSRRIPLINAFGTDESLYDDASPQFHIERGKDLPWLMLVHQNINDRLSTHYRFRDSLKNNGYSNFLLFNANPYDHNTINSALGNTSDNIGETDSVISFFKKCLKETSTGVFQNEKIKEEFIIYPNPANTTLFIQGQTENISQFEIINIFGQTLQSGMVEDGRIDVSNLENGIYFLKTKNSIHKFMVVK